MREVVIASTYPQAALVAEQRGLRDWRWARRRRDILGLSRGSKAFLAVPVLGGHEIWDCIGEADNRGLRITEVRT